MKLAPRNLQQVAFCYTLVHIFPTNLRNIYSYIYKSTELESTLVKILNPKKTSVIPG